VAFEEDMSMAVKSDLMSLSSDLDGQFRGNLRQFSKEKERRSRTMPFEDFK
jgi:hypothetical protein